ncbi:cryptochrome/photolyase family protein [Nocardiopsis coralliicola]
MAERHRAVVLFTRDLRVHDHPALAAALDGADEVVPLFVLDPRILRSSARNRNRHLGEALSALRAELRERGGDLAVRRGDTVAEVLSAARESGAQTVFLSDDVSRLARSRREHLERGAAAAGLRVRGLPGVTVVPPGAVAPSGGTHYRVFTPYWHAWEKHAWRRVLPAPEAVPVPRGLRCGPLPGRPELGTGTGILSPAVPEGGEPAARRRMAAWLDGGLARYDAARDLLAADATSRLSADLRFGCLSPLELAAAARQREGGAPYVRQLAWRDFHHQVTAAVRSIADDDYRPRGQTWRDDPEAFAAWCEGRTGVPIVDAGMRQLRHEGFMHNRARMIAAWYLTRRLGIDWRRGGRHFGTLLLDGDVADEYGNWQWVAGTGNDTRPNRRANLIRQAHRFDPDGAYVRRYVPELGGIAGRAVHTPWTLDPPPAGYPAPLEPPGEPG